MSLSFFMILKVFLSLMFFMFCLWLVSLYYKNLTIIDRFWGITFSYQSIVYAYYLSFNDTRVNLLSFVLIVWSVRLFLYLSKRGMGEEEDYRYKAIRQNYSKEKFLWYSLFIVFFLQGFLSFVISAPIIWVCLMSKQSDLSFFDIIGFSFIVCGFLLEAIADKQLSDFKKNKENRKKVCKVGLWSISRHPNYLGEIILWCGIFIIALGFPYGIFSFYGPALMIYLLIQVSGAKLVEKEQLKRKSEYMSYTKEVPAIFPSIRKIINKK